MYKGSCLCGAVTYEISGHIRNIIYCHCSQCRKAQGSAFATNGIVDADRFRINTGLDCLAGYEPSPGYTRFFCHHCGSPMLSKNVKNPDQVRVRLGTIESDIAERPQAHIFVTSKANWDEISDGLPCYDTYEPNR